MDKIAIEKEIRIITVQKQFEAQNTDCDPIYYHTFPSNSFRRTICPRCTKGSKAASS